MYVCVFPRVSVYACIYTYSVPQKGRSMQIPDREEEVGSLDNLPITRQSALMYTIQTYIVNILLLSQVLCIREMLYIQRVAA